MQTRDQKILFGMLSSMAPMLNDVANGTPAHISAFTEEERAVLAAHVANMEKLMGAAATAAPQTEEDDKEWVMLDGAEPFDSVDRHLSLLALEELHAPKTYIDEQRHLNAKMHAILLDWIIALHQSLRFRPQTLHLTARIVNEFLAIHKDVTREKLQLVGLASFLIAAKEHEPQPPLPDDCAKWADNAYSGPEVAAMEDLIMAEFASNPAASPVNKQPILPPTPFDFLVLYLHEAKAGKLVRCRAQYYCERVVQEHDMLVFKPSLQAAAAVYLAVRAGTPDTLGWTGHLVQFTGYTEEDLRLCATKMSEHIANTVTTLSGRCLDTCKRKYSTGQFFACSKMHPPVVPGVEINPEAEAIVGV